MFLAKICLYLHNLRLKNDLFAKSLLRGNPVISMSFLDFTAKSMFLSLKPILRGFPGISLHMQCFFTLKGRFIPQKGPFFGYFRGILPTFGPFSLKNAHFQPVFYRKRLIFSKILVFSPKKGPFPLVGLKKHKPYFCSLREGFRVHLH